MSNSPHNNDNKFNNDLKSIHLNRKQQLIDDIAAAYKQLGTSLSEVDKTRINRLIKDLENELAEIQSKIDSSTNTVTRNQPHPKIEVKPNQKATSMDRKTLFNKLTSLVPGQFNQLLFEINPPSGLIPATSAAQAERVSALLQWAESPTGCGLDKVQKALENILNNSLTSFWKKNKLSQEVLANILNPLLATSPNQEPYKIFERKYIREINQRCKSITLPSLKNEQRIPIDEIYVPSDFLPIQSIININNYDNLQAIGKFIDITNFIKSIKQTVLLGDPGNGKSTFTLKLCYELTKEVQTESLSTQKSIIPILIVVRDFALKKKEQNCSILEFMEMVSKSLYQLSPPSGFIENLLNEGRAVVIFDGLDELLDTNYRKQIRNDIESFFRQYPLTPILITSRYTGYENAPLDKKVFQVYKVAPFSDKQVKEYVNKWFNLTSDLSPEDKSDKVNMFIKESSQLKDLTTNPLMLSLICTLYKNEGHLPQNRLEVYEKCSEMLFDKWDKSRGIRNHHPYEHYIKSTIMHLANWIYQNQDLQNGISENKLISEVINYLCPETISNRDKAEEIAKSFIDLFKGRAWVFTDVGDDLYQFSHRTFLEYFTALYLVRTHHNVEILGTVLIPKIENAEWEIVAQLSFQIIDHNQAGALSELLTRIVDKVNNELPEYSAWNLLLFAAKSLTYTIPNVSTRKYITKKCLDYCIEQSKGFRKNKLSQKELFGYTYENLEVIKVISFLLYSLPENRTEVFQIIKSKIIEFLNGENKDASLVAEEFNIGLYQEVPLHFDRQTPKQELINLCTELSNQIFEACKEKITLLARTNFIAALDLFFRRQLNFEKLLEYHTIEKVFSTLTIGIFSSSMYPITILLLDCILDKIDNKELISYHQWIIEQTDKIAQLLLTQPTPWGSIQILSPDNLLPTNLFVENNKTITQTLNQSISSNMIFVAFSLTAYFLELANLKEEYEPDTTLTVWCKNITHNKRIIFNYIRWSFIARFEPVEPSTINNELNNCNFSSEQKEFILKWVNREISLVGL